MEILNEITGKVPEPEVSITDLIGAPVEQNTLLPLSAKGISANLSILGSEPTNAITDYQSMSDGLLLANDPSPVVAMGNRFKNNLSNVEKATAEGMLYDESTSDVEKMAAIESLKPSNKPVDFQKQSALEAIIKPEKNETPDDEDVRVDLVNVLQSSMEYKRKKQAIMNSFLEDSGEQGIISLAKDLGELFLPMAETKYALSKTDNVDGRDEFRALMYRGKFNEDFVESFKTLPLEERIPKLQEAINIIKKNGSIYSSDPNFILQIYDVENLLSEEGYTGFEKGLDTVAGWLDLVYGGTVLKTAINLPKAAKYAKQAEEAARAAKISGRIEPTITDLDITRPATEIVRDAERSQVIAPVMPTSPAALVGEHNADQYRAMVQTAENSEEGAEALFGADKADVAVEVNGPTVPVGDELFKAKLHNASLVSMQENLYYDDILELDRVSALDGLTEFERATLTNNKLDELTSSEKLVTHHEMTAIADTPTGAKFSMFYGPTKGFKSASEAFSVAKEELLKFGINPENITIMKRVGDKYKPVGLEDVATGTKSGNADEMVLGEKGKYLVKVDYDYKYNHTELGQFEDVDVKSNIFDYLTTVTGLPPAMSLAKQGSLQQNLIDHASTMHRVYTQAFTNAVNKKAEFELRMINHIKDFNQHVQKLPKARRAKLEAYLNQSNELGRPFDRFAMQADGFTQYEIKAAQKFRQYWDTVWFMDNKDKGLRLSNQGYKMLVDNPTGTNMAVRPIVKQQVDLTEKVLDHRTGAATKYSQQDVDDLYNASGSIVHLKTPVKVGNDYVEYARVENAQGTLLNITENTRVLDYRNGYFKRSYDDQYFVVETYKTSNGTKKERVIASAATSSQAERLAKQGKAKGLETHWRGDLKRNPSAERDWDIDHYVGKSSERFRGQRLTEDLDNLKKSEVLSPVEAMIKSTKSVASRAAMKPVIDRGWARFAAQYGDFIPTVNGQKKIPSSVAGVEYGGTGVYDKWRLADARTTYNYMRAMEDGYINLIDEGLKGMLYAGSELVGSFAAKADEGSKLAKGLEALELGVQTVSNYAKPVAGLKMAAFYTYLASNPLRQMLMQSQQALQLAALNPKLMSQATARTTYMMQRALGLDISLAGTGWTTKAQADKALLDFKNTGHAAAISKQALLRGAALELADYNLKSKVTQAVTAPMYYSRKMGFDAGEWFARAMSYNMHYATAASKGDDINDAQVLSRIAADAENFNYNMNLAGDMPYNTNTLAWLFTYQQVPHKALMNLTLNRQLSKQQKLQLAGYNLLMYGLPMEAVYKTYESYMPKNPEVREKLSEGFMGWGLNLAMSQLSGDVSKSDWGSLSPIGITQQLELFSAMMTVAPMELFAKSPAGQLVAGANPRFQNAMKTWGNWFYPEEGWTPEQNVKFGEAVKESFKVLSGYRNFDKASFAHSHGYALDDKGNIVDSSVSEGEAAGMVIGMPTRDAQLNRILGQVVYEKGADFKDQFETTFKEVDRLIRVKGVSKEQLQYHKMMAASMMKPLYDKDPETYTRLLEQALRKVDGNKEATTAEMLIKQQPLFDRQEFIRYIDMVEDPTFTPDMREGLKKTMEETDNNVLKQAQESE